MTEERKRKSHVTKENKRKEKKIKENKRNIHSIEQNRNKTYKTGILSPLQAPTFRSTVLCARICQLEGKFGWIKCVS